jgi:hypothetical protein
MKKSKTRENIYTVICYSFMAEKEKERKKIARSSESIAALLLPLFPTYD